MDSSKRARLRPNAALSLAGLQKCCQAVGPFPPKPRAESPNGARMGGMNVDRTNSSSISMLPPSLRRSQFGMFVSLAWFQWYMRLTQRTWSHNKRTCCSSLPLYGLLQVTRAGLATCFAVALARFLPFSRPPATVGDSAIKHINSCPLVSIPAQAAVG